MKRTIVRSMIVLVSASLLLSSCGARAYTFNGKKTKFCGCREHKGMVG